MSLILQLDDEGVQSKLLADAYSAFFWHCTQGQASSDVHCFGTVLDIEVTVHFHCSGDAFGLQLADVNVGVHSVVYIGEGLGYS